jgi:hypothetical protein
MVPRGPKGDDSTDDLGKRSTADLDVLLAEC